MALTSQGLLRQGSGTVSLICMTIILLSLQSPHVDYITHLVTPVQLNPSPTVNGAWHKQLKLPLNKFSLTHSALGSQGIDKHGSGTDCSNKNMKSSKLKCSYS